MKKITIILLCVTVAVVGVGIFLVTQKSDFAVEDILPQKPLVYVQLNDVEKNMSEMASMPFWQAISHIDYDLLIKQSVLNPQQAMFVNFIRTQLPEVLANPMFKKLFGNEVTLAVYSLDSDVGELVKEARMLNPQVIEKLFSGIYLVTRINKDVQLTEYLSRSLTQFGANVSQGQVEYKGEVMHTISVSGIPVKFAFVRLKDLLVMGIGEAAAYKSIDVYKKDSVSLVSDPQFAKVRSTFLSPSSSIGFFDFQAFLGFLKGQVANLSKLSGTENSEGSVAEKEWDDVFDQMAGFETFAFSFQMMPIMRFSNTVLYDSKKLNPDHAALYTCSSGDNRTLRFIPKEVLGYQWNNCLDINYYWREMKKEILQKGGPDFNVGEIEAKTGLSVEGDILPAFGDEFGGYLSDIQIGGFFPIPKLLLFVEIKDKAKAQRLLDKLQDQPLAILQEEIYNGVPLKYFALPLGEMLQPGYGFLGDYLLISTSRQLIKDSIDASNDASKSLTANSSFKEINFGLTDTSRGIQFVRVGKIIEKVKGIIGWSDQWFSARDQKAQAFEAGSQKPLEEVVAAIAAKENELEQMNVQVVDLEDQIWDIESTGGDASLQKTQIEGLRAQVKDKKLEIVGEYERKDDLENILQKNTADAPDPALRQLYLDEVVYPILDGLKSIDSYGLRVTSDKDMIKSVLFLKVSD